MKTCLDQAIPLLSQITSSTAMLKTLQGSQHSTGIYGGKCRKGSVFCFSLMTGFGWPRNPLLPRLAGMDKTGMKRFFGAIIYNYCLSGHASVLRSKHLDDTSGRSGLY